MMCVDFFLNSTDSTTPVSSGNTDLSERERERNDDDDDEINISRRIPC
jgi:hypothetical protein